MLGVLDVSACIFRRECDAASGFEGSNSVITGGKEPE